MIAYRIEPTALELQLFEDLERSDAHPSTDDERPSLVVCFDIDHSVDRQVAWHSR